VNVLRDVSESTVSEFEAFAAAEIHGLLRYAVMLTGDRELARDPRHSTLNHFREVDGRIIDDCEVPSDGWRWLHLSGSTQHIGHG
jgi:hypothetical protein